MKQSTSAPKAFVAALAGISLSVAAFAQSAPPQIKEYQEERPVWDKTSGFGPVPKNLQIIGDAECQKVKYDRAVGYSKKTLNPDGKTYQKGGFMCQNDPGSKL